MPKIGYGSNKKTKFLMPDGFYKFLVNNVQVYSQQFLTLTISGFGNATSSQPKVRSRDCPQCFHEKQKGHHRESFAT